MNEQPSEAFRLFPQAASTVAPQVDMLYLFTLGISIFFSVLVAALVIVFCIRYRHTRHAAGPDIHSSAFEWSWIAALTLLFLGMFGWSAIVYARIRDVPKDALEINVVAKQWMWKFQYPGGRRTIDELVAPIDRPVRLLMTSQDVIHSLYVPAFRIKQDVLPFRYTTLWFQATRLGSYHLFCAEYCGTSHAGMGAVVRVLTQPAYARFIEGAPGGTAPKLAGEDLFRNYACVTCHGTGSKLAPSLVGLFGKPVLLADGSTVTADEDYLRESIQNPTAKVVAGFTPVMPNFAATLSEEQVFALVDYIKSLHGAVP